MATTLKTNNFVRSRLKSLSLTVSGTITAGDMVYLATTSQAASLATAGTTNANASVFLGVAADSSPRYITDGVTETPTNNNIQILTEGEFVFVTTGSQTLHPFDLVYLGATAQTVNTTATGSSIGVVSPDQRPVGGTLGGNITGTGTSVVIKITPTKS